MKKKKVIPEHLKQGLEMRKFTAYAIKHKKSNHIVYGGLFEDRLELDKVWSTVPKQNWSEYERLEVTVTAKKIIK